jgi:hypothetical protein
MNQPDVVLFEKIACCSQSNKCVHVSSLFTSSQSTGMSTCSNDCNVCGKHFKRLESHPSQNLAYLCPSFLTMNESEDFHALFLCNVNHVRWFVRDTFRGHPS